MADSGAGDQKTTAKKRSPAGYFLLVLAILIGLFGIYQAIFIAFPLEMMKMAYVPKHGFDERDAPTAPDYGMEANWYALPGSKSEADMRPEGIGGGAIKPDVDIFFIHPTTFINSAQWNAPLDDERAEFRTRWFVLKNQTSAFNPAGRIIAPRYRQATFGAFLDDSGDGTKALLRAHQDILAAFDTYIADMNNDRPFILAGHSQGALHGLWLLKNRIAGTPIADRMVAAYLVGWPIGMESDLGALDGIDACTSETEIGCVISWQTFAASGDPSGLAAAFEATPGLNGKARKASDLLCTNPLSWTIGGSDDASANLGAVGAIESKDPLLAPTPSFTGAACRDGFLILDRTPREKPWNTAILPGENYHVHDVNLFYVNVRVNAAKRARTFIEQRQNTL